MTGAGEIGQALSPWPRLEDACAEDLLALTPAQVLSYAVTCRDDLRSMRLTLSEALALIGRQRDLLARAARVINSQRQQLRDQQEQRAAA